MPSHLWNRPEGPARATLLLAHGAGAPMDTAFMTGFAERAAARGIAVARFEFAYMAGRREDGRKRPPPRADKLIGEFEAALEAIRREAVAPLLVGGKSMGGRVAAMLAGTDAAIETGVKGVVCLGYPFHPPGKPEKTRLEPLRKLKCPALICQGERDPFGGREEVAGYELGPPVTLRWMIDGNHDLAPRKAAGTTSEATLDIAAEALAEFAMGLA